MTGTNCLPKSMNYWVALFDDLESKGELARIRRRFSELLQIVDEGVEECVYLMAKKERSWH